MEREQRPVGQAEADQPDADQVATHRAPRPRDRLRRRWRGRWLEPSRVREREHREQRRHGQRRERAAVATAGRHHRRHGQRPRHRAELIHRGVHAEHPPATEAIAGRGDQRRLGRAAHRLAQALDDDQRRHGLPRADHREQRRHDQVGAVAEEREQPVAPAAIGRAAHHPAQRVADQLAGAGDEPDRGGARAQLGEVRPHRGADALVTQVGPQADHAHREHEAPRPSTIVHDQYRDRPGSLGTRSSVLTTAPIMTASEHA